MAAVCGFEDSSWAVRNSSMMLFASIMQRAVGGAKNAGSATLCEGMSVTPPPPALKKTTIGDVQLLLERGEKCPLKGCSYTIYILPYILSIYYNPFCQYRQHTVQWFFVQMTK